MVAAVVDRDEPRISKIIKKARKLAYDATSVAPAILNQDTDANPPADRTRGAANRESNR
jgi:hypothetical protein